MISVALAKIGDEFSCGDHLWRITDVGSRVIVAISIDSGGEENPDNLSGPPYSVEEVVFDEYDFPACTPADELDDLSDSISINDSDNGAFNLKMPTSNLDGIPTLNIEDLEMDSTLDTQFEREFGLPKK